MDAYDKYLVLTFVGQTRILAMNAECELGEVEIPGFDAEAQTLYCGNTVHDHLVQVGAGPGPGKCVYVCVLYGGHMAGMAVSREVCTACMIAAILRD